MIVYNRTSCYNYCNKSLHVALLPVPILDACLQEVGTPVLGPVWVSTGEGFSPAGACKFLDELIHHLNRLLQDAKFRGKQVVTCSCCTRAVLTQLHRCYTSLYCSSSRQGVNRRITVTLMCSHHFVRIYQH